MLRGLKARGDVLRNADEEWIASPALDWHILPARVEGVLKERIGRLSPEQQTLLQIASVVGETFSAETLAHIQGVDKGRIINQLGSLLDRKQGLIQALGRQTIGAEQRAQFRFHHILFQQ